MNSKDMLSLAFLPWFADEDAAPGSASGQFSSFAFRYRPGQDNEFIIFWNA
jgi:hypothetical protein